MAIEIIIINNIKQLSISMYTHFGKWLNIKNDQVAPIRKADGCWARNNWEKANTIYFVFMYKLMHWWALFRILVVTLEPVAEAIKNRLSTKKALEFNLKKSVKFWKNVRGEPNYFDNARIWFTYVPEGFKKAKVISELEFY